MNTKPETAIQKVGQVAKTAAFNAPFLTGIGWSGKTIWPWLVAQAGLIRTAQSWKWPDQGAECLALIGLFVIPVIWFTAYFVWNVWKEIERDEQIYIFIASKLAQFPSASRDLAGRWWDRIAGPIRLGLSHFMYTRKFLREMPRLRKVLDVRNLVMTQANHLELEDVYIDLKAASRTNGLPAAANPVTRELRQDRAGIGDHLRVLKSGVALAIVGPPGSGKTTLLRHLLLKFAWNQQGRLRVRSRVPLFVEIRKLPKYLGKTDATLSLPVVLGKMLKDEHDLKPLHDTMPQNWLLNLLKRGRCILLCDGLDEIPDVATRKRVAQWLDDQINHTDWRENLFLVTARPAGYESAPLGNVRNLEVQPFDWDDTRAFIRRWYRANRVITMKPGTPQRDIDDHATQDAEALLAKLRDHSRLGVLTSNPLLLTMVCLMHEMGQLPGSRSQLYKEICEVHLERWRRRIGSAAEPANKETWNAEQKLSVLRPLAFHLMRRGATESATDSKRLSTNVMLTIAAQALDHIGVKSDRESQKEFFQNLHDESGLWLQLDPDQWGFAHLSFQEYLCADQWFATPGATPQESEWADFFEQSWWRETLLLYASKTTDLRPMVRAALAAKSPRSLSFLFALENENVSIPGDLRESVDYELNRALGSQVPKIFTPAAEAWLLRQQEMGYSRIDDLREVSSWVTEAEYQLFLNELGDLSLIILQLTGRCFAGDARSPALGMAGAAAKRYCSWLDHRFSEFRHRLGAGEAVEMNLLRHADWSTWLSLNHDEGSVETFSDARSISGLSLELNVLNEIKHDRLYLNLDQTLATLIGSALAMKPAILERPIRRNISHALGVALPSTRALGFFISGANSFTSELARERDLARDLARDLELLRDTSLVRVLDLSSDRASQGTLSLALALDFGLSNSEWNRRNAEISQNIISSPNKNRWRLFQPLFRIWAPDTKWIDSISIYRRFLVTCFDVIREHDHTLLAGELLPFEYLMRLLVNREDGKAVPFEGIRVIRERRS